MQVSRVEIPDGEVKGWGRLPGPKRNKRGGGTM